MSANHTFLSLFKVRFLQCHKVLLLQLGTSEVMGTQILPLGHDRDAGAHGVALIVLQADSDVCLSVLLFPLIQD